MFGSVFGFDVGYSFDFGLLIFGFFRVHISLDDNTNGSHEARVANHCREYARIMNVVEIPLIDKYAHSPLSDFSRTLARALTLVT